jgi:putative oxidoreductase
MNNASLVRIGTILYALVIGFFGINHFLNASGIAGMLPSFFHGSVFWVYFTGLALILAALAFLIGKQVKIAGILLALFLIKRHHGTQWPT